MVIFAGSPVDSALPIESRSTACGSGGPPSGCSRASPSRITYGQSAIALLFIRTSIPADVIQPPLRPVILGAGLTNASKGTPAMLARATEIIFLVTKVLRSDQYSVIVTFEG